MLGGNLLPIGLCLVTMGGGAPTPQPTAEVTRYLGMCEASGAVALGADRFVVANDEDNDLRVYSRQKPEPLATLALSPTVANLEKKADIEGATAVGDRIYWIASHSRNSEGEKKEGRHRLFAVQIADKDGKPSMTSVGRPYTTLLADLGKDSRFDELHLDEAAKLAAEAEGGLNIEGLSATPQGELLIGFRNPLRGGKALVVQLRNPADVLQGGAASFGPPLKLDLGGLGIRSLEYSPARDAYVVMAGPAGGGAGAFRAFQWSGPPAGDPVPLAAVDLSGLVPEAFFFVDEAGNEIQVLSDDGDTCASPRAFRSRRVPLPAGTAPPH